jgi:hypothetical protein
MGHLPWVGGHGDADDTRLGSKAAWACPNEYEVMGMRVYDVDSGGMSLPREVLDGNLAPTPAQAHLSSGSEPDCEPSNTATPRPQRRV